MADPRALLSILKLTRPFTRSLMGARPAASELLRSFVPEADPTGPTPELDLQPACDDRWITRARPTFLYVMYGMILWALPMGFIAALSPRTAEAMARGVNAYLTALPEPLYVLFGTGYLGYATLRQWEKTKLGARQ
jgi:hypothetical protein